MIRFYTLRIVFFSGVILFLMSGCDLFENNRERVYHFNVTNNSGAECGFYIRAESSVGRRISRVYRLSVGETVDIYYYYSPDDESLGWDQKDISDVVYFHVGTDMSFIQKEGPRTASTNQNISINPGSITVS